jgi:hypothetical protein
MNIDIMCNVGVIQMEKYILKMVVINLVINSSIYVI